MNTNDEAYVWDYPSIKRQVLEPGGIADYTIEKQTWPLTDPEGLKAKFKEMAKLGREAK